MTKATSLRRHARRLRARSTDAERRLWCYLRSRRTLEIKFRRQHPMGRYIVDFVCLECRLVVELDGGQHQEQARDDRLRDQELSSRGFLVLRFWDNDALLRTEQVLEAIWTAAHRRLPSPPAPLPQAGEG